jgi:lipoyl(octanoyl) transferase
MFRRLAQTVPPKRRLLLHPFFSSMPSPPSPPSPTSSSEGCVKVHSALEGGCLDYARSWAWQHVLLSRRLSARRQEIRSTEDDDFDASVDDADCVLLLEHSPVYTLGRGADEFHLTFLKEDENEQKHHQEECRRKLSRKSRGPGTARLAVDRASDDPQFHLPLDQAVDQLAQLANPVLAPNGVPIYRVERGGEVTFHGPSQLVVYPLLDLQRPPLEKDLHWYLRMVEEVVIQTLKYYDIEGIRDVDNTGVWVGDNKVAAVGIASSRWITTHGFAINVDPNLGYFDTSIILPCGIEGKGVTSMANVLRSRGDQVPTMKEVADVVVDTMEQVFGIRLEQGEQVR